MFRQTLATQKPTFSRYRHLKMLLRDSHWSRPDRNLKRSRQNGESELRSLVTRGIIATKSGDYDLAIAQLRKPIEEQFELIRALSARGYALFSKGETAEAFADFDRAIACAGDRLDAWVVRWRARCRVQMGDLDGTIKDLTIALDRSHDKADYLRDRADVYQARGQLDEALADLDQAVRLQPNDPQLYVDRSVLFVSLKRAEPAIKDASRLVELRPDEPMGYFLRAKDASPAPTSTRVASEAERASIARGIERLLEMD